VLGIEDDVDIGVGVGVGVGEGASIAIESADSDRLSWLVPRSKDVIEPLVVPFVGSESCNKLSQNWNRSASLDPFTRGSVGAVDVDDDVEDDVEPGIEANGDKDRGKHEGI